MMDYLIVDLSISPDEYLKLYQGVAKDVFARARDGRNARFPAQVLRPFVTREGVRGSFCIFFDQNKKFESIRRL